MFAERFSTGVGIPVGSTSRILASRSAGGWRRLHFQGFQ